ncbi:3-hydroxyacyl-CoA dehydrogenase family protein [Umezawaea tangerina]|uniref:3-hydroxyacyl-CoA dehydrogenase n=1 Tax=Umezawaea tangerina TaxID=84725 RepID=A0A2T0T7K5_9PSEU|nr:3-hydroxyacyl-CoA dehydrogenase family protein [Umezawaea tangerina]PRY41637.1 3-hydroxyacyl-CoA dehydrogenase [Umezawaea tangerina]
MSRDVDAPAAAHVRQDVSTVMVVGAGLMGSGIAQVAAQAGLDVVLVDDDVEALDRAAARIADSLARFVRSGSLTDDEASRARGLIVTETDLRAGGSSADLVIEAIVEKLEPKQRLFAELDAMCAPDVVLATNTSQFQIGRVAANCDRPDRVIGMHWSNPPQLMKLVELVVGPDTSSEAVAGAIRFLDGVDRRHVLCLKDVPGFISNRMSTALFMEGVRLVDEGIATAEDVDLVARLMFGHKMGPLETLDLAGLDTALLVSTALADFYGGDRFTPPDLLERHVAAGRTGRKSGSGFYEGLS